MLHVTNGESAAAVLRAAGFDGDILCWNDVLHEGPVPDLPANKLRGTRARFLSDGGSASYQAVLRDLTERDLRLLRGGEPLVLWFEHDLYDQLQLIQILDALAHHECGLGNTALVCGAEYVGLSAPARLRERYGTRAPVTNEQIALARTAWSAFTAPEPQALLTFVGQDSAALPFLRSALVRHLQQYPSTFNGLSRTEQAALDLIASGVTAMRQLFDQSQRAEEAFFLGDAVFLDYMQSVADANTPLVTIDGDGMNATASLTEAGRDVLRGAHDHVRLNGIDRWYGGVHLQGSEAAWRWDGGTLIAVNDQ